MRFLPQKSPIPIGIDDFSEIITQEYLYIDKTLFIKEFWDNGAKTILITRPRRFGKSIALSMMRYFFEQNQESQAHLFAHTDVWQDEEMRALQGSFPVIYISFKDIKAATWEKAYGQLKSLLAEEVRRTLRSLEDLMSEDYKENFRSLIHRRAEDERWEESLFFITAVYKELLFKNTIVLIDEYDAPITHAYVHGYYEEMVAFMRQLLSRVLKGNAHLCKGFMTGVVRTAKDGILSGLNNLDIYTMLDKDFSDKFGFTGEEVDQILARTGHTDKKEEVTSWYNGYFVGIKYPSPCKVYNPWSVLKYLKAEGVPETYWANTGSSSLLERLIVEAEEGTQKELKLLLEKGFLEHKQVNQDVILLELDKKNIEPWSFLFFAGYLTASQHVFYEDKHLYTLSLPNKEITDLLKKLTINALNANFSSNKLQELLEALVSGMEHKLNKLLEEFIQAFCSFHDLSQDALEKSLHMFVLGLLASLSERYIIKSNLESGDGRYDILMHPKKSPYPAIIIEFKKGKNSRLEKLADQALQQICEKNYTLQVQEFGYQGSVLCYGIAAYKKQVVVKMQRMAI